MRIVMMGTGPFAVPTFRALVESEHDVLELVTRPTPQLRPRQKSPPNPMRQAAEQLGIDTFAPEDVNAEAAIDRLRQFVADLFVVCDFGQILSPTALEAARLGGINLHGSLLPAYRGAAPVNWALIDGCTETGVTVIHMTPKLDGGPCLAKAATEIRPDETAPELEERLSQLGIKPVFEAIEMLAGWDEQSPIGQVQDQSAATKAPRLKKQDGRVDWKLSAREIRNRVRGLKPWPGSFTVWHSSAGKQTRLILDKVSVVEREAAESSRPPGEIVHVGKNELFVAAGDGILSIDRIQPAGKRVMEIAEFLRGHSVAVGEQLGDEV